jgi:cyclophilin family peptidyl-prolyl cis-trans isomerase
VDKGSVPLVLVALALLPVAGAARQAAPAQAAPVAVFETAKGVFEVEFFPQDAPKSVAHLTGLIQKRFYRGQRVHRVTASLVQFGDPTTRDVSRRDYWGSGGSGQSIGVAEFSKRTHARGIVALAHSGDAARADSQMFILKAPTPAYDGKYTIVGRVVRGMDVVDKLVVTDVLKQVTLR